MTEIDHAGPSVPTMSAARLCGSVGLFMLCNIAGAAIIPLIAMVSA